MKALLFLLISSALTLNLAAQAPHIATVDVQELFHKYYRTELEQQEINIERARIQKENNQRLEEIRNLEDELSNLRQKLKREDLNDKERQDVNTELRTKFDDAKHKERARQEYLDRRHKALNQKMQERMRALIAEIQQKIAEKASAADYDYILDISGRSTQGIPFVLHSKDNVNLTAEVLAELNQDQPQAQP